MTEVSLTTYGGLPRMPSAFAGGSILDLPVDPSVLLRGFYVTYDRQSYKPAPKTQPFVTGQQQTGHDVGKKVANNLKKQKN